MVQELNIAHPLGGAAIVKSLYSKGEKSRTVQVVAGGPVPVISGGYAKRDGFT